MIEVGSILLLVICIIWIALAIWLVFHDTEVSVSIEEEVEDRSYIDALHGLWSLEYGKVLAVKLSRNAHKFKGYVTYSELLAGIANDKDPSFNVGYLDVADWSFIFTNDTYCIDQNTPTIKLGTSTDLAYMWLSQLYFRGIRVKALEEFLKESK